jgi:hypothetical protein
MDANFPCAIVLDADKYFVMAADWLFVLSSHANYRNVASREVDGFNRSLNLSRHPAPNPGELTPAPSRVALGRDPFAVFRIETGSRFAIMEVSGSCESCD